MDRGDTDLLSSLSPAKRQLLRQRLRGEAPADHRTRVVAGAGERQSRPSYAQQRLWLIDQLEGGSTEYHLPEAWRLRGDLDSAALARALNAMVDRHATLRTRFDGVDGEPVVVVDSAVQVPLPVTDLSGLDAGTQHEQVMALLAREWDAPFDLARGPVLRASLMKLGPRDHVFVRTCHHVASDGWSQAVFNRELGELYGAFRAGRENPLRPLAVSYADYAAWQREWLDEARLRAGVEYWRRRLAGAPEQIALATDRVRPAAQTFEARRIDVVISRARAARMKAFAQDRQATPYMALLAAFAALLARYAGQDDIVIASPIANRPDAQLETLIGFFVNRLLMRVRVPDRAGFAGLLADVQRTALDAYQHADVPFDRLVEALAPPRRLNVTPLHQVSFALQNLPLAGPSLPGLDAEPIRSDVLKVRVDLEVHGYEHDGEIRLSWVYNTHLFERWRIEQMARHFDRLLDAAVSDPDRDLRLIDLLGPEERRHVLDAWNDTRRDFGRERPVTDLIDERSERSLDAVAIVCDDQHVTFGALRARAGRLARELRRMGVGRESRVALCLHRSVEMVVGMIGVLRTGAAYVPIHPDLPPERQAFVLEDSGASILLTQTGLRARVAPAGVVRCLDGDWPESVGSPADGAASPPLAGNAAYIIYTSGTTGTPKGVVIEHRQLANYVRAVTEVLPVEPGARCLVVQPLAVDASVLLLYAPLLCGGQIHLVSDATAADTAVLSAYVERRAIDCFKLAPSHLAALQAGSWRSLLPRQWLALGGEAVRQEWVTALMTEASCRLFNHYGPTETTVAVLVHEAREVNDAAPLLPIGRPIANVRAYVVDEGLQPAPIGVAGELLIGGKAVARGYLDRPGLTADRFVADPFGAPGARVYRTGDRARWRRDGTLEFLGRGDDQVKIRGFRVELGEIEHALRRDPRVEDAVVVFDADEPSARLLGYVSLRSPTASADGEVGHSLRQALRRSLPDYMVPAAITVVTTWPRTPHGKVDRRALPRPAVSAAAARPAEPCTAEEELLCGLFADVLDLPRVGVDEDFFAIGGHSLLATRLISRVRSVLELEPTVRLLFEAPTVRELAARLREAAPGRPPLETAARPERVPLSFPQQRLWFIDRFEGTGAEYNLARALRLRGDLDAPALERAIQRIVERHESLRTSFAEIDGIPFQVIEPVAPIRLPVEDLRQDDGRDGAEEADAAAARWTRVMAELGREADAPFVLSRGPLLRVRLLKLGDRDHVLLYTLHHIVSDGWSHGVFNHELLALYGAFRAGRPDPLPALAVQYADFALWQRAHLEPAVERSLDYWRSQLAGAPDHLPLPTDRPRSTAADFSGDICEVVLDSEQQAALARLCRASQSTLFMTLVASCVALFARYSAQHDITIGSPIANRQDTRLEPLIGFFVNSLVLRVQLTPRMTLRDLLGAVRRTTLDAYRHQDVPFERLVEELAPPRSVQTSPFFQVVFALQNAPWIPLELPGLGAERVRPARIHARHDLEIHAFERDGRLRCLWAYKTSLFDRRRIEQMARHFGRMIDAMTASFDQPFDRLALLAPDERRRLLEEWNDTAQPFDDTPFPVAFQRQARRTPDAVAVDCGDTSLTYADLGARATHVAGALAAKGIGPECLVGIALERSSDLVVAMLAVLEAGAAYVPLDLSYPAERLAFMIDDARLSLVLCTRAASATLPASDAVVVFTDLQASGEVAAASGPADAARRVRVRPEHAAYCIYTSGSTGVPKAVVVAHRELSNYLSWAVRRYAREGGTGAPVTTGWGFDATITSLYLPLLTGQRVIIWPERTGLQALSAALREGADLTLVKLTPAHLQGLRHLVDAGAPIHARRFVVGGEALNGSLAAAWHDQAPALTIVNEYGPTETVVGCCVHEAREADAAAPVPIGAPTPNTRLYVVDESLEPVPVGVTGELYIGGLQIARGYLRRASLTASRFVADPFGAAGTRMYRTGDLARWRWDGELDFAGRRDDQVKIRGFRVELGEIESGLRSDARVEDAVVVVHGDGDAKRLTAYVVPHGGSSPTLGHELHARLRRRLPDFAVPASVVVMDEWPLSPNGKLDRDALPAPAPPAATKWRAARTPDEELLCAVFAELLGVERVGVDDDFFALGGHSLLATRLVSRVRTSLGFELPLQEVFATSTVADLASVVAALRGLQEPGAGRAVVHDVDNRYL